MERNVADAQFLSDGVEPAVKNARDRLTDERDLCAAGNFLGLERAAGIDFPFARLEPAEIDAIDGRRPIRPAGNELRAATREGRRHLHARNLARDRARVVVGQRRRRPAAEPHAALRDIARGNDQEVGAEAADLRHHLLARAAADRDHRDHGRDADDDAEHGERAAQLVQPQRIERGKDGVAELHAACPGRGGSLYKVA